jgi:hypothetical protein
MIPMIRLTQWQRQIIAGLVARLEDEYERLTTGGILPPWKLVEAITSGRAMVLWGTAFSQSDVDVWMRFEYAA